MRILVIQQKRIGDVLVSTILCNNLRRAYPKAQIDYLIYSFTKDVVVGNPNIDNIILFEDKDRKLPKLLKFGKKISSKNYDIIVDPYNKLESAIITSMSNAKQKIAFKSRYKIYNQTFRIDKNKGTPEGRVIHNRLGLIQNLVDGKIDKFDFRPKIYLEKNEIESCKNNLEENGIQIDKPIVVFGILGSVENKTYPRDFMINLINNFQKNYDCQILLNYFPNQKDEANEIYNHLNSQKQTFLNCWGEGLRNLAAVCHFSELYVGNDCGHPHIAKAMGTPTFTIFSPFIKPEEWGILENLPQNDSFHITDIDKNILDGKSKKEIIKENYSYYKMMNPKILLQKIENHIRKNNLLQK